jgi:FMN phosphatase YigB (HAD superfamily)
MSFFSRCFTLLFASAALSNAQVPQLLEYDGFLSGNITGERGVGKPKPEIFEMLLSDLGVSADRAVMVGNSLERDIAGAINAKLAAAIWIQVLGSEERAEAVPHHTIRGLHEIPALVAGM